MRIVTTLHILVLLLLAIGPLGPVQAQEQTPSSATASPSAATAEVHIDFTNLKAMIEAGNEKIRASKHLAFAARHRVRDTGRFFLPSLDISAAQETFRLGPESARTQPEYGVEARVNIFNGGKDRLRSQAHRVSTKRHEAETKIVATEQVGAGRELYWRILYAAATADLLREALASNKENLLAADRRIKSGVATISDRLEFEMNQSELSRELARTELEKRSLERDLLVLLGREPTDRLILKGTLSHDDRWEVELQHTHADHEFLVRPSHLRGEEARLEARAATRSWLPKVDVYAAWLDLNQRSEDSTPDGRTDRVIGIRASMSLLDGFNSRGEAAALREEATSAGLLASHLAKETEAHVAREFQDLHLLHSRVHEEDENIKRARTYYQLTQSGYTRGVKSSSDVLGATQKLYDTKRGRLEIIRDFQIARGHVLSKIDK